LFHAQKQPANTRSPLTGGGGKKKPEFGKYGKKGNLTGMRGEAYLKLSSKISGKGASLLFSKGTGPIVKPEQKRSKNPTLLGLPRPEGEKAKKRAYGYITVAEEENLTMFMSGKRNFHKGDSQGSREQTYEVLKENQGKQGTPL